MLAVAALAPVLADLPTSVRVPSVVAEILLGILVGPDVLGLAAPDALIEALSQFGLALLFFLAGMEIDFNRARGAPLTLAARGWALTLGLGMVAAGLLYAAGVVGAPVLVGLALTTTALGALVPILKDAGLADGSLGRRVLAAGPADEFGPIVTLSVVLAVASGELWRTPWSRSARASSRYGCGRGAWSGSWRRRCTPAGNSRCGCRSCCSARSWCSRARSGSTWCSGRSRPH